MPTPQQLVSAIRKLVQDSPNAVYHPVFDKVKGKYNCLYNKGMATNNRCGCLIGQGLVDIGVELLPQWDNFENPDNSCMAAFAVSKYIWPDCPYEISEWLDMIQNEQDYGSKWQKCLDEADKWHPKIREIT